MLFISILIFYNLIRMYNNGRYFYISNSALGLVAFIKYFWFLNLFYNQTELIWQEGLLVDFLQKNMIDSWINLFSILSGFLFSESFFFENIISFYLDFIIWVAHSNMIFEFNSVGAVLMLIILLWLLFPLGLFLIFLFNILS